MYRGAKGRHVDYKGLVFQPKLQEMYHLQPKFILLRAQLKFDLCNISTWPLAFDGSTNNSCVAQPVTTLLFSLIKHM